MRFTLHVDPAPDVLAAAKACEADAFLTEYGNTPAQWDEEYGPYDPHSVFVAVCEPGGDALGAMRMIMPSPVGLKSLIDTSRPPWQVDGQRAARSAGMILEHTWDVATVAVRRGTGGGGGLVSAALYHGLLLATRANRARWIVMIMDARARRLLNMAGLATSMLPGTRPGPYLGSAASVPLWAEVSSMVDGQRRTSPDAHRLISLGIGLDGVDVPTFDDFVVRREPLHQVGTRREERVGQPAALAASVPSRASMR